MTTLPERLRGITPDAVHDGWNPAHTQSEEIARLREDLVLRAEMLSMAARCPSG
jgi:hypothetical protein